MAQTKTRSSTGGGSSRSKNASSSTKRASSSSSKGSRPKSSTQNRSSKGSSSGSGQNGKSSNSTTATIAEKAKKPALAGGAALVAIAGGIAGGMALSKRNKRSGLLGRLPTPKAKLPSVDLPKIDPKSLNLDADSALKAIGRAAGEIAQRSHQVGDVATEVQKATDSLNGKH